MTMLEDRRSEVLRALVEEHIKTGEPVSSRAVLERSHLSVSGATVRNDLAALENEGLVLQPHTSAGRVPTAAGYRYYVDHIGPGRLRHAAQERVSSFFGDVHLELSKLLKATSDLLVEITDLPSVVVAPGLARENIRAVHIVQVSNDQILMVAVTEGGRVIQQRGRVRVPVTPLEIEEAQQIVAGAVVGQALADTPQLPENFAHGLSEPVREAVLTITDCLHLAGSSGTEMFLGGTQRMAQVWQDLSTVQRILEIMEREAEVMSLLAGAPGTSIQLGEGLDMAVVSKAYESGGEGGSVGVIGPMRMNYKRVISAVEEVTRELEEQIGARSD
ncbi:MAG TPA: heat-inducible transcriptional repressor HrcA [Acidimicrobiia bacterium]|nr:heat-inducible transcriptional repressor HrcA [Acidimicrobiia bacterium]